MSGEVADAMAAADVDMRECVVGTEAYKAAAEAYKAKLYHSCNKGRVRKAPTRFAEQIIAGSRDRGSKRARGA